MHALNSSLPPNYHPPSRLHRGNFHPQCFRNMATGLIYVSSKPLDLHPNAPATKAIDKLMKEATGQLQTYDIIYNRTKTRPRGLALSLIVDFANTTVSTQKSSARPKIAPSSKSTHHAHSNIKSPKQAGELQNLSYLFASSSSANPQNLEFFNI